MGEKSYDIRESFWEEDERYVDPLEPYRDADGGWMLAGSAGHDAAGGMPPGYNERFLSELRAHSRALVVTNEFAINAIENRINYVIGAGHKYKIEAKDEADAGLAERVVEWIDAFQYENNWYRRQEEILRRRDRDGEVFVRLFRNRHGEVSLRFVEPDQVATPDEYGRDPAMSFGIHTDDADVETVLGYWIDGKYVQAADIQHRKANVDTNVKRGLPLFYPVRKNLRRAEKLLRNMSVVAEIQSAIALIRKHETGSADSVRRYVQNQADVHHRDPSSARVTSYRRFAPGTIVDAYGGVDYQFPIAAIDASRFILVLQAELRAIAARLVMPEFMLTSDASNANYSSTMVAEGPAVRMFERLQHETIRDDLYLLRNVVNAAVDAGRFPADTLARVALHAIPPTLAVRDRYKEILADKILLDAKVLSGEYVAMKYGLDGSEAKSH